MAQWLWEGHKQPQFTLLAELGMEFGFDVIESSTLHLHWTRPFVIGSCQP